MSEDLSEEEKQKKQTRERMRQEYYFAIKEEGNRTFLLLRGWRVKSLTLIGWGIVQFVDTFLLSWGWRLKGLTLIGWRIVKLVVMGMEVGESHPDRVGKS